MKVLALSDLRGSTERVPQVVELVRRKDLNAIVFCGNIIEEDERAQAYRGDVKLEPEVLEGLEKKAVEAYEAFYDELGELDVPVFVVPGLLDAPKRLYYQATLNHEVVAPNIYMVHRSFALPLQRRNLVVAGFGGGISDDPHLWELDMVQLYPSWLLEFGLDYLRHFEQDPMLVFHIPPTHGNLDLHNGERIGHRIIDHVIKTYRPRYAFVGAARDGQGTTTIGSTLVINPGWLKDGKYATLDIRSDEVEFGQL